CQPWNQSPIVRAMWRAAREDLRGADGPKTLLVITDGMDNRFAEDKLLNRDKKGIGPFLAANFRDIKIQIIGFKFAGGEKEKAMEQFQEIAQLPIKGEFATVEDVPNLVDRMMRSVVRRGLSYRVIREDDHPLADQPDPRDVSEGQANEQWLPGGLRPGTYTGLLDVRGALPARVQLDRGDLLLLEAVPSKAGALRLRRALWSETVLAAPVAVEQHGWRLAVLENRLVKERGLEMLLTLETRTTALPVLQQVKPALTWIDVTPAEGKAPFHRRWRYHYGYPAPAWSVESPLWPAVGDKALATPQVRVWWSETLPPSAMAVVERDVDFKRPGDLVDRTVRVGDGEVVIESVRVEQRRVETRQPTHAREGKFEVKSCLVVRVRHSPQNPVQVSVEGLEPAPAGEEHRYYGGAGKYTALFWSVTADQADLTLRRLKLVSLAALKREAVKGESVIEVKNLREPQKADFRPPEPVELTPDDRDQTPAAPGSGPKTTPLLLPAPPLPTTPVSLGSEAGPYLPPAPVALPTSRQPSGAASRPR
ncbi:MAG TPA: hypothetical protein VEL76_00125, partial [Gemmataceae bacterium]|nr:hypothetical protein [Gemmataceae bacterium]